MPIMSSFAVFVERPPKEGKSVCYTALEVQYHHSVPEIERMIADYLNEKRVNPIPAGCTHYMLFTTDSAQSAANQARAAGLVYKSSEEVLRIKASLENAKKFGNHPPMNQAQTENSAPRFSDEEIRDISGFCDELERAFGSFKGNKRHPF